MQEQDGAAPAAASNAQQTFEYGSNPPPPPVGDVGIFDGWFFNMFAGAIDIQIASPMLTLVYIGCIIGLVMVRVNTDNPVRILACTGVYIYTTIQAYTLFQTSNYVLDYTTAGWQVTAKSAWFAFLFTTVWVWGVSRIGQTAIVWLLTTGLGPLLRMINPSAFDRQIALE